MITAVPRGRPMDARVDDAVVAATTLLLAEHGYGALTTSAIARRAGVSTASLYRRWATKEELVASAARTIVADYLSGDDTGSLDGDLTALLGNKITALSGDLGIVLKSLVGQAAHDPAIAEIIEREIVGATETHIAAILDRAMARGEIQPGYNAQDAAKLAIALVTTPLLLRADGPAAVARLVPAHLAAAIRATLPTAI
ncbi:TetR/AcrR family transcriptional regulator [Cryobacterium sp. TMB1-7]|uniref:TetR/AcrR family transcriptional regulator n=1 Tax=Cryobacterium sp. TMB1-7 TaxID=2555866 RepID=UPI00106A894F|nr:TetR/AcrR family transcriptional regulator [Cryobacterium sp. TMB1-7]TFC59947.1 TetR/AcrR family transcriptional regulator [Cryobacterium sp. TMB1-7]